MSQAMVLTTQKYSGGNEFMLPAGIRCSLSGNTIQSSAISDTEVGNRDKAAQTSMAHACFIPAFSGHIYAMQHNL